jgi:hypothetical protein
LNNIQELIAPNLKFGRVQRKESDDTSPEESSSTSSSQVQKKRKPNSASFSQFELKDERLMSGGVTPTELKTSRQNIQLMPVPMQQQQQQQLQNPVMPYSTRVPTPPLLNVTAMQPQSSQDWQQQRIKLLEHENMRNRLMIESLQKQLQTKENSIPTPPGDSKKREHEYKMKYIKLLPSKIQTNLLVDFYLQNIDYIYHSLHHPSFKKTLEEFWKNEDDIDIGWLATLFMVLGLAAIHLPKGFINIDSTEIDRSHKIWFGASKECVTIADSLRKSSSEFNLYTLQWFSLCQLYFYATKRAEQLNDILSKAIKDAHAMGLDKDDKDNPNLLEMEMKRRLWWDICGCDTFRSLSLGVKPIIRSYNSTVPFPSNCNDADITPDAIKVCSINQPTDNSFNIYRAVMMKIMNGMFEKRHQRSKSLKALEKVNDKTLKGLLEIDIELCHTNKSWFFELDKEGTLPYTLDSRIHFQHHMLHTCICIHRFRLYQNYLQDNVPVAMEVARSTAKSLFSVYRRLRTIYDLKNPLFLPQIHQSFTGSVIQSMMLLVKQGTSLEDKTSLYADIDLMLNDLQVLSEDAFILKPEILKESFKVLNVLKKSINKNLVELEKDQKDIVSNVFGGADMTESYLKKCMVSFIIDQNDQNAKETRMEQEKAVQRQQEAYSFQNQLGVMIDDALLEKSVEKINEIDFQKIQTQQGSQRPMIVHPRPSKSGNADVHKDQLLNGGVTTPNFQGHLMNTINLNNHDPMPPQSQQSHIESQVSLSQQPQSQVHKHNLTTDDHSRKRGTTPFELNFNDFDTFWNDMGQQGLDELNNMYYSDFSGYKIT